MGCNECMYDAPYEFCCKFECGEHEFCRNCNADCQTGICEVQEEMRHGITK